MIEEPYRWVEAVANRREYIETQLAPGSPIAAVSCREGILFLTVGRAPGKIFEIYDRIAMGAIGHPGDIERLRMAAIELASTEGFTRSAADVSLRRLAYYSLSPLLKNAFEQIYGAPYLARMLFGEVGAAPESDLFLRVEYDGAIASNGGELARSPTHFGALAGSIRATELMEKYLAGASSGSAPLNRALKTAMDAWCVGHLAGSDTETRDMPSPDQIAQLRKEQLATAKVETALLERNSPSSIRYRVLTEDETKTLLED
jgi:proteasome alpha subunit